MNDKYVDYKTTVWQRAYFNDNTDMKKVHDIIKEHGLDNMFDIELGFKENQVILETEEHISIEDNNGASTVEIYDNHELIWKNGEP